MRLFYLLGILTLTLQPLGANSQERPPQTPPSGPLIRRVPEYADWTTTFKYTSDDKSSHSPALKAAANKGKPLPPVPMRQERVIKTKDIIYSSCVDEMGAKEECWSVHGVQWITPKGSRQRELAMNPDAPYFKPDLQTTIFLGFEWISASNYIGVQRFMDKECLAFQATETIGNQTLAFAYVDLKTRLPVLLKTGDTVSIYTFAVPPSQQLSAPDDIAKFLQNEKTRTSKIMAPGAR